mgnify:CR=1 FL=1
MSKKKIKLSKEAQELNDKLVQLSKTTKTKPQIIKRVDTIQFVSPNASIYKNSATIILKGKKTEHRIDKKKEHQEWLDSPGKGGVKRKDTDMRKFEDPESDFLDRWDLLGLD